MSKLGQIKFQNSDEYQIYELIRKNKGGGGLALGVRKDLCPVWVRSGDNTCEALTIQINANHMNIRITNAYGPQNYDDQEKKQKFWQYLENEVLISQQNDSACMIMMDSNC